MSPLLAAAALLIATLQPATPDNPQPAATYASELQASIEQLRAQLPIDQGPFSVTAVELRDLEVLYTFELAQPTDREFEQRFAAQLPAQACSNPEAVRHFRQGGTYTYRIRDREGRTFTTSISSC